MGFGFASALFGQIDSKKPYLAQIGFFFRVWGKAWGTGLRLFPNRLDIVFWAADRLVVVLFQGGPGRLLLIGCCRV